MHIELPEHLSLDTIPDFIAKIDKLVSSLKQNTTPRKATPRKAAPPNHTQTDIIFDFIHVKHLDMSGIGALVSCIERFQSITIHVQFENVAPQLSHLLDFIDLEDVSGEPSLPPKTRGFFEKLGRNVIWYGNDSLGFLEFLGKATISLLKEAIRPYKIRWSDTFYYLETTGLNAMPIVGLIALLLGMIIAFQSADQLKQFGANIFVVELLAISMLRELAPLITSILIAGRSGSAFTAEIGTMKVSEEVDAMEVMGLDLIEYLVSPKFWALIISLPLLVFWADILSLLGGAFIANWKLDIPYYTFLLRLQEQVAVRHLLLGLGKCYMFAAIISIIGCYRGLLVSSGAGSVGRQTTSSVVTSIFLVIIADAVFSIIFTLIGI